MEWSYRSIGYWKFRYRLTPSISTIPPEWTAYAHLNLRLRASRLASEHEHLIDSMMREYEAINPRWAMRIVQRNAQLKLTNLCVQRQKHTPLSITSPHSLICKRR